MKPPTGLEKAQIDGALDYGCLFNDQLKCEPVEWEGCPDGFGTNEDGQCFPLNSEWECSKGYHTIDDDETGQRYTNE
jgi:hypothetical protein